MSKYIKWIVIFAFGVFSYSVFADNNSGPNLATIANNILGGSSSRSNARSVVVLLMAVSATLGSAFALLAVLKFKQHKDNPQQTHLGQPFALFLVAVIFIWLPYYLGEAGYTLTSSNRANDRIDLEDSSNLLCPPGESDALGCPKD